MKAKIVLKNIARKSWLTLLWSTAVAMTLLMIAQFVLWSTLIWLGTPVGQKYAQDFISRQFAGSSYKLDIAGLSYALPTHFTLDSIKLYEGEKTGFDATNIKLIFDTKDISKERIGIFFSARIMDKPVEIKAQCAFTQDIVILETFSAKAPDLIIKGSGSYNDATNELDIKLSGTLESLRNYPELVGSDHNLAPLSFNLTTRQNKGEKLSTTFDMVTKQYSNKSLNISAKDIALKGSFSGGTVNITSLTARDHDKGTFSASGTFKPKGNKADLLITARESNLIKGDIVNGVLDGDLKFQGDSTEGYLIVGTITAHKLDVTIPERISSNIPQLNVEVKTNARQIAKAPSIAEKINLDIYIKAPRRIIVRGWGLDAEFGGELKVKGTAARPLYYGNLESLRGRYSEFGKVFKFTNAKMRFSGSIPPSPKLDIKAKTKAGDITAIVTITGSVMSPKIGFSSEPAMPEDEVLSYILFGEEMENLSPFQAVQLARTFSRFTGQGGGSTGLDPIGTLRNITGLDDLRVGTDEQGSASIGAGKYLTDKVYLEFESGMEEGSGSANVQIELTPNITLESEIGQDSSGGVGLFWKRDY